VVNRQFNEVWRRFQARRRSERALVVAIPIVVTLLVIVGAWMLSRSGPDSAPGVAKATISTAPGAAAKAPGSTPMMTEAAASTAEESPADEPGGAPRASPTPPPGEPVRFVRVVNTDGQGANLRRAPDPASQRIKVIREGAELELIGPNRQEGGETWRNVQDAEGDNGWISADFLADVRETGPRPTPTPTPLTIQIADITSPVGRGQKAELVITTRPGTRCQVRVFLYGPSSVPQEGLEPKVSDDKGECAWSWTVPEDVVPGTWRYFIAVGRGDQEVSREVPFVVS
jgi:SH3-like domain-containing protein